MVRMKNFALLGLFLIGAGIAPSAQAQSVAPTDTLKKLSLEQLMDIEVISVSKRPEKLTEAAAAIQVVTNEDIRRSGVALLPEALRLAPNLHVGQSNAH